MLRRRLLVHLKAVSLVAVGGFAGANLRYAFELAAGMLLPPAASSALIATFLANVLGSFALGLLLYGQLLGATPVAKRTRLVFGTGFLASLTTYSTFALQIVTAPSLAIAYVGASYACGFGAVVLARTLLRRTTGATIDPNRGEA